MSQQELDDLAGVSQQTIIQLERNRYNPSLENFGKSSIVALIWLVVIINVIAKFTGGGSFGIIEYLQYTNTLQWVYTSTIIVKIPSVFVVRKLE
ncbi:helix-turn-helix transcriptional regulator [Murimonas intestini]|uniref:Helix-turn-helix protein n=1 Tax=Murimonas intestini TaxID=1337051 RepID=A0AB73SXN0_9FIRM